MKALYLHIPFCLRKCPYCDFFSVTRTSPLFQEFPRLLMAHLRLQAERDQAGPFSTVFFGGGTPSLLSPSSVEAILAEVDRLFGLEAEAEVTLEANPGTLSLDILSGFRAAGINRLSLGLQSLRDDKLQTLGRLHTAAEGRQAVGWARQAGFDNLSCDLMFGLPAQSLSQLMADVEAVLSLQPEHLSCYGLTVEEGTPFEELQRQALLHPAAEDLATEMYVALHERLSGAGYDHYEISNYARPGHACRHNQVYWRRQGYLGLGPGAHSFSDQGWGERWEVPPDIGRYARALKEGRDPRTHLETFDRRGAMAETLYLGLREAAGVDEACFRARFGQGVAEAYPTAVRKASPHLLYENGRWYFALSGWLLYDHLIQNFL
ncbi:MAG: radical SAM family heme chaperone HemW [Desulfuromonadales bacterium]|nr:radical SAM family heme chaperone HemW [Desulfuromonadales bacterium]MDW7756073.1 radical SAM family heme chaperone HemW [Desulfuromonadales bacterium]